MTWRPVIAFALACIGVYAFSFALDLVFGMLFHVYPVSTTLLPVATWGTIGLVTFLSAGALRPHRVAIIVPCVGVALIALYGAIVGTHPHSYAVAFTLILFAAIVTT